MCTRIDRVDAGLLDKGVNAAVLTNMLGHPRALVILYKRDRPGTYHNALDDARHQAACCRAAYAALPGRAKPL